MADCLFCEIVAHELDADIVHETPNTLAFRDINPVAPVHVLVIPKRHVATSQELGTGSGELLAELFETVKTVAEHADVDAGYRLVTNIGAAAGQTVPHVHFHVIGGRSLSWPPG